MTPNDPAKPESTSKSTQVRQLLPTGMTAAAIAEQVGCTVGLVYNIKSTSGQARKRGPGRPRKTASASATAGIAGILDAVKKAEREREQLHSALQRIHAIVADALA